MDPVIVGGLVTAGAGIANSIIQNRANKKENELAYQRRQQEINKMNVYNSPAAQVSRLRAAGLSPNLAYGGAGEVVGSQTGIADPIPTHFEQANFSSASSLIDAAVNAREQLNRNVMTRSQIALNDNLGWSAVMRAGLDQQMTHNLAAKLQPELDQLVQNISESKSREDLNRSNILVNDETKKEIQSRYHLNEGQLKKVMSEAGYTDVLAYQVLSKLPHELANMDADTALKWMQTSEGSARIREITNNIMLGNEYLAIAQNRYGLDVDKFSWSKNIDQQNLNNRRQELNQNREFQQGIINVQDKRLQLDTQKFSWQKKMDVANYVENAVVDVADIIMKVKNPLSGTVVNYSGSKSPSSVDKSISYDGNIDW